MQYFKENQQDISINETSGTLSLLKNASQLQTHFTATIEARTPVLSVSNKFQGYFEVIEQDSWKTPLFNKSIYFVEIPNTSKKNDHVFKIQINDPIAELRLLGNDLKYFDIEKNVNWIILKDDLESGKVNYSVVVEATSKASSLIMKRDSAKVFFQVIDSHCHPRIFDENIYLVDILPEWMVGSNIFTAMSNLPGVTFSLSGEYVDYFYINNITGSIHLMEQINICQRYELLLFGQRKVPPYYNDTAKLILQVSDPNCNVKLFPKEAYLIDMLPDWNEEKNIFKVSSLLPNVTFSLEKDVVNFTIDPATGEIFFIGKPNICKRYELTVFGKAANPSYHNGTTQLMFISDVCIKKTREFSKCVYSMTIKNETEGRLMDFRESNESSNVKFEISEGNDKGIFEIENGQLILTRQPEERQYRLKVRQITDEKLLRSIERNDNKEVSNREALVIVNVLHPADDLFKLFLPTAPLSDYWFTVKATSVGDDPNFPKFSIESKDRNDFEVDSSSGLISPKIDVTMIDGYNTSFVVSATASNYESTELKIYIYRLIYNNILGITLKSNSANMINLKNIERNVSKILQCNVHILQYMKTSDSESYELIVGAIKDHQLLNFRDLEDRMKIETEALQGVFGNFGLGPYTKKQIKKDIDDDPRVDPLFVSTFVLACLSAILCILILVFVLIPKLRSNNVDIHRAENEESHSEKETPPPPDASQLEVVIDSEMAQPDSSTITPVDKGKTEDSNQYESSVKGIPSNEAVLQDCENNENSVENEINKYEDERNKSDTNHFPEKNIQPKLNDCVEEITQENITLLENEEADNETYFNEAFEDTSFNLIDKNKISHTDYNEDPTNQLDELEKTADNDASPDNIKKKNLVKFNDIATLIP